MASSCSTTTFQYCAIYWIAGLLDCWIAGVLECWIAGLLDCWIAGVLECWSAGVLDCWIAGVLECWSAGLLECWSAGLLDGFVVQGIPLLRHRIARRACWGALPLSQRHSTKGVASMAAWAERKGSRRSAGVRR